MPKDTREKVTLSPEAYKALEVEAMLHGSSLKDTASKLILKAACPKCKEILDIMARPPKSTNEEETNGPITQEPKGEMAQEPNVIITHGIDITPAQEQKDTKAKGRNGPKAKRKILSKDPMALEKVKVLYTNKATLAEISRETGYSISTLSDNIKRMKERGEL